MSEGSVLICFFFFLFLLGNQIFPVPKDIGIFRWVGKINNHPHLVKISSPSVVKNILVSQKPFDVNVLPAMINILDIGFGQTAGESYVVMDVWHIANNYIWQWNWNRAKRSFFDVFIGRYKRETDYAHYIEGIGSARNSCVIEYFGKIGEWFKLFEEYFKSCSFFVDDKVDIVLRDFSAVFSKSYLLLHDFQLALSSNPLATYFGALPHHFMSLSPHLTGLTPISQPLKKHDDQLQNPDSGQRPCKPYEFSLNLPIFFACLAVAIVCLGLAVCSAELVYRRYRCGWFLLIVACGCLGSDLSIVGFGNPLTFWHFRWLLGQDENCENGQYLHGGIIVPHKHLTDNNYWGTVIDMANVLNTDRKIAVIGALTEGSSIRSIERITGVHRDTIMRLGVKVGQGCAKVMDATMRNLPCNRLEMDEIWGFVGKKDRNVRVGDDGVGSVWTFCAIDAETKLVPAFKVGNRDIPTAKAFVQDVAERMAYRVQISTDGLNAYVAAMESAFGEFVDYGQIIKTYGHEEVSDNRRYSAPKFVSCEKKIVVGNPDERLISTSYVERLNATTRLHMRRLTRLTLAFSKKRENFEAAVALHFAYYNFVKRHNTLRCTPAMAAGVTGNFWSVGDLVEAAA